MLVEIINAVVILVDDLLDRRQIAGDPPLRDPEDELLRAVYYLVQVISLFVSQACDPTSGGNQAAQRRRALYDPPIVLHVDRSRDGGNEVGNVCCTTYFLQLATAVKLIAQGNKINRLSPVVQVEDSLIDPAVFLAVEIVCAEKRRHVKEGVGVYQQRPQYRLLGLQIMRSHSLNCAHISPSRIVAGSVFGQCPHVQSIHKVTENRQAIFFLLFVLAAFFWRDRSLIHY